MPEQQMTIQQWEELNVQHSKRYATLQRLQEKLQAAQAALQPCDVSEAMRPLTPNLMLCCPSGMTEADRVEWLKAAVMTIGDIPRDLLEPACFQARKKCDHPAKIVPFICKEVEHSMQWRESTFRNARDELNKFNRPKAQPVIDDREQDRSYIAAEIGALAKELERKAQMSEP